MSNKKQELSGSSHEPIYTRYKPGATPPKLRRVMLYALLQKKNIPMSTFSLLRATNIPYNLLINDINMLVKFTPNIIRVERGKFAFVTKGMTT